MTAEFTLLFPGQGSQTVAMLAELALAFPVVKSTFASASATLGYDLWDVVANNPDDRLNQTQYTQPALLAASVAVWRCWQQLTDAKPTIMAGHSLGEYSALVCAGVIDFEAAVDLVASRGLYMQQAVATGVGAMAAIIGLENVAITAICTEIAAESGLVLSPANYNSHGQTVVAGHLPAVELAVVRAKASGAKLAKLIPVSVPSHCALMQPAAQRLAQKIDELKFSAPAIAVIQNADVAMHDDVSLIKQALIAQLTSPVRWVETVEKIVAKNISLAFECGPAKVLAGLNKRIDKRLVTHGLQLPSLLSAAINELEGES